MTIKMNNDRAWLERLAERESQGVVSAGGWMTRFNGPRPEVMQVPESTPDVEIIDNLTKKVADLEEWLSAERERREAVDDRLRDARDELRRQSAEMADMQKVNGQLRGRIAELEVRLNAHR